LQQLTSERNLCKRQNPGHDVWKDVYLVALRELREAEEHDVEDDAADVEEDERDEDLAEVGLQVHVAATEDGDGKDVACKKNHIYLNHRYSEPNTLVPD
jgi:hypothetical protein